MKDFDLRGYLSNNRLLESKDEVVGGSTNAGGPYIETYVESQNQTSTVTEAEMGREKIEGVLWDLEQVIRKIAHISGKSTQEAAQLAVDHMQEVFDEDNLDEAGTLKA